MKIVVAADHAGLPLKEPLIKELRERGHEVEDLGAYECDVDDDYPDYAVKVGEAIRSGRAERGIVFCGSGVGVCVAINKFPGVRAAICHDTYSATQGVEHDDMNVLCVGGRIIGAALARAVVLAFADARFSGEERHVRRLEKVRAIEQRFLRDDATEPGPRA